VKAYRKEMLGKESYSYLGRPSFLLRCPEPGCMQEYAVYLGADDHERVVRNWLDRRLQQDHAQGNAHRDALDVSLSGDQA
jgi:hypothetical protein